MLLSMTGHGEATVQNDDLQVAVEIRTINNRYLKLSVRAGEGYNGIESRVEPLIRQCIRRGTVQVNIRVRREPSADDFRLNITVLESYREQLDKLYDRMHLPDTIHLDALLALPGVIDERRSDSSDTERDWPMIEQGLTQALESISAMREEEGRAMADDLMRNCATISEELGKVESRAPIVVEGYSKRLVEKINNLLAQHNVTTEPADIVREVGIFAERCDISEEIVRLRSHLEQFDNIMQQDESNGRKLEFLTQELFRETNTIGSKANDAEIARHVIEMKASIERMREMIQNAE